MGVAVLSKPVEIEGGVESSNDQCGGLRAPGVVGNGVDSGFCDIGMIQQHGFDFGRVDVLTAADDEVVTTVEHGEIAVGIEVAEVAGAEPPVAEGVAGSRCRCRNSRK